MFARKQRSAPRRVPEVGTTDYVPHTRCFPRLPDSQILTMALQGKKKGRGLHREVENRMSLFLQVPVK